MLGEGVGVVKERIGEEEIQKRSVYEAICALADTVEEDELQRHLSVLVPSAWCEVVEERFLGRLCGFPLCANTINVDLRKKYTIVRRRKDSAGGERKMIVPTDSEPVKFCSDRCMGMSRAIIAQLAEQRNQFVIPKDNSQWKSFLAGENAEAPEEIDGPTSSTQKTKFGVELVTKLNDLKLADAGPTEAKDEAEEGSSDSEHEEKQFLQQIKAFVTKKGTSGPAQMSNSSSGGTASKSKEWKRDFLLGFPPSSADKKGENEISLEHRQKGRGPAESSSEIEKGIGEVRKHNTNTPLVGEVIERMAPKCPKGRTERDAKKPKVVEAPRISVEQVRQTF
uniref:RNA polymerase II subunit B1 CTD phosphatase RPAP2 homolog n=1 Tax=Globodera rostochiensis TaxID=31243 RepID=A0A914H1L7_GLORO